MGGNVTIDVKDTKITQKKSKLIYNNHAYFTVKQTNESSYEILDFKGEDKENDL